MARVEQIGDATLYLGDCREILPTLGKVDAVVTDPPYGIGKLWKGGSGHGWGKASDQAELRNSWDGAIPSDVIMGLIRSNLPVILWGGNYFPVPASRGWLVWNKPERNFTLAEAELAWTNVDMRVRVFDHARSDQGREHPTQKPVALMKWCIELLSKDLNTFLDPFMGSGTTGVACAKLGRKFIGIEIELKYFDIACRRIEAAYKQPDMFITRPAPAKQEALI